MSDGKNSRLRTRQPLQRRRGNANLKYTVNLIINHRTGAFNPHQSFRFDNDIFCCHQIAVAREGKRRLAQGHAAKSFRARERRDLIEQWQRLDLPVGEVHISIDVNGAFRKWRMDGSRAGTVSGQTDAPIRWQK